MPSSFKESLYALKNTLFDIPKVFPSFVKVVSEKKPNIPAYFPPKLAQFYTEIKQCNFEWEHIDFLDDTSISGSVKMLPVSEIDRSWEGVIWFEQAPVTYKNKHFKIIDFFMDETVVGFYDDQKDECLYLYFMQGEPVSLQLDIAGYVDMMAASLGFIFWQQVIVSIIEGRDYPSTVTFKEHMPKLLPNFDWEEYKARFEKNRLNP